MDITFNKLTTGWCRVARLWYFTSLAGILLLI